jgi:hypothetical protein
MLLMIVEGAISSPSLMKGGNSEWSRLRIFG